MVWNSNLIFDPNNFSYWLTCGDRASHSFKEYKYPNEADGVPGSPPSPFISARSMCKVLPLCWWKWLHGACACEALCAVKDFSAGEIVACWMLSRSKALPDKVTVQLCGKQPLRCAQCRGVLPGDFHMVTVAKSSLQPSYRSESAGIKTQYKTYLCLHFYSLCIL